jgi:IS30 family transposase
LRQIPYLAEKARRTDMAHSELDLRERRAIEDVLNANVPVSKRAAEIGRHRSTV